jgi:serine/threonine protein kinase
VLQRGALDETLARFVVGEVCAALLSVHELGLAFNDLKPENVLVTEVGHVKLADFGACRAVTSGGEALLARGNVLLHNLRGASPRLALLCLALLCPASCVCVYVWICFSGMPPCLSASLSLIPCLLCADGDWRDKPPGAPLGSALPAPESRLQQEQGQEEEGQEEQGQEQEGRVVEAEGTYVV